VEQSQKRDARKRPPTNPKRVSSAAPLPPRTLAVGSPTLHLTNVEEAAAPVAQPAPRATPRARSARRRTSRRAQVSISGGSELWHFDGETPSAYAVQQALAASAGGIAGTFQWTIRRGSRFADFGGSAAAAGPNVTLHSKVGSAARHDVQVRVDFAGVGGQIGHATRNFTVRRPDRLHHLRNVDNTDATYGYMSHVHYSIQDQFRSVLPRNVDINEQFTAAPTADFAGMNWRPSTNMPAVVNPSDWEDMIGGEAAGFNPAAVGPRDAHAGVRVNHWPGVWRVGSSVIGRGRQVARVIWQKFRGKARHR
jgi:hypothetical protein